MKKIFFIFAIALFAPNSFFAQTKTEAKNIFANSYDNVNDFEKILNPNQVKTLNGTLKSFETKTGKKIIVVTISSTPSYRDLSNYSEDLHRYLNIGLKIEPSILFVISKDLRQIQILGDNKISDKLSNQEIENIVNTFVVPELKKGDYYKGLETGTAQIIKKLE
ncbi:TPM domain-containing protein [Flavobacterium sp. HTF]|uniref:TPM domain-containing protein n=1 Tax=Flavobacterium sp. HTF TaxID=2170732 RepID=UPI000D5CC88B|nr:TPM domain-containing protein [Flavobacterium sp. HTF]PWB28180.1 TPM domain-containing protein [Flavobacterium sp. HTF]